MLSGQGNLHVDLDALFVGYDTSNFLKHNSMYDRDYDLGVDLSSGERVCDASYPTFHWTAPIDVGLRGPQYVEHTTYVRDVNWTVPANWSLLYDSPPMRPDVVVVS